MTPIFPELPRPLGVYTLTRLLELRSNTALYEARQTHVDRAVVLEVLAPGVPHAEEVAFLAQARQRVASDGLPHVTNVLESLRAEGLWFLTQELPKGRSLADIAAAGDELSVSLICGVVAAAAEMYGRCQEAGLSAMPLAASSIFVEDNGQVHFLTPLVEGKPSHKVKQMKTLAASLWEVCPRGNALGIGRTVNLIQWLNEGREGQFLTWEATRETAVAIQKLIEEATRKAAGIPLAERFKNWLNGNPRVRKIHAFLSRWGKQTALAIVSVVIISATGTMFGMAAPRVVPAESQQGILCQHDDAHIFISRYPVSVQQYHDFLQALNNMQEDELQAHMQDFPNEVRNFRPMNWDEQWERGDVETPVMGVSYWGALLYTRVMGGSLPTAQQVQAILSQGADVAGYEWTSNEEENPLPGLYSGKTYLLCDSTGTLHPINDRNWVHEDCTFRIMTPDER